MQKCAAEPRCGELPLYKQLGTQGQTSVLVFLGSTGPPGFKEAPCYRVQSTLGVPVNPFQRLTADLCSTTTNHREPGAGEPLPPPHSMEVPSPRITGHNCGAHRRKREGDLALELHPDAQCGSWSFYRCWKSGQCCRTRYTQI